MDDHAARAGSASAASGLSVVQPSLEGTLETWPGVPEGGYNRVLLKLSGEMFAAAARSASTPTSCRPSPARSPRWCASGTEVAVVIGGGNFFRGAELQQRGMDRVARRLHGHARHGHELPRAAGLPARRQGIETRVQTAITMGQVAEPYIPRRAIRHLEKGRVVIFGAGLGHAVLLHRHHRRAARARDRLPRSC